MKAVTNIDWNLIALTEIYEAFDMALKLLDEDFEYVRKIIDAAIKHGATPESMTKPIEKFAVELHAFCEAINSQDDKKQEQVLSS